MELTFPEGFVIIAVEMEPFGLNAFQIGGAEVCSFLGRPSRGGGRLREVLPWWECPDLVYVAAGPVAGLGPCLQSCDLHVLTVMLVTG